MRDFDYWWNLRIDFLYLSVTPIWELSNLSSPKDEE